MSAALVENTNLLAFKDDKSGFELLHKTLDRSDLKQRYGPFHQLTCRKSSAPQRAVKSVGKVMQRPCLQASGGIFTASCLWSFFHGRALES